MGEEQEEEMSKEESVCVVLMTYGSPATLHDIPEYLRNIRGGRDPDDALVAEFRRRYERIGGSPLIQITRAQAAALEEELNGLLERIMVMTPTAWWRACGSRHRWSPTWCELPRPNPGGW